MAHRKAGGTARNLTDSKPKYLGVKIADGDVAKKGQIIIRQRGTKIVPGKNVAVGKDHTIFALADGTVKFDNARKSDYTGVTSRRKRVSVV